MNTVPLVAEPPRAEHPSLASLERASVLLRQAGSLAAGIASEQPMSQEAMRRALEEVSRSLDSWRAAVAETQGAATVSHRRFAAGQVIERLRLSRGLRGGARRLQWAIERAARILWPGAPDFDTTNSAPSASTLQRYELALDVAFMLLRSRLPHDCVRFMWMDSSPQKQYDWVWAEYVEVPTSRLVEVLMAVRRIFELVEKCQRTRRNSMTSSRRTSNVNGETSTNDYFTFLSMLAYPRPCRAASGGRCTKLAH